MGNNTPGQNGNRLPLSSEEEGREPLFSRPILPPGRHQKGYRQDTPWSVGDTDPDRPVSGFPFDITPQ